MGKVNERVISVGFDRMTLTNLLFVQAVRNWQMDVNYIFSPQQNVALDSFVHTMTPLSAAVVQVGDVLTPPYSQYNVQNDVALTVKRLQEWFDDSEGVTFYEQKGSVVKEIPMTDAINYLKASTTVSATPSIHVQTSMRKGAIVDAVADKKLLHSYYLVNTRMDNLYMSFLDLIKTYVQQHQNATIDIDTLLNSSVFDYTMASLFPGRWLPLGYQLNKEYPSIVSPHPFWNDDDLDGMKVGVTAKLMAFLGNEENNKFWTVYDMIGQDDDCTLFKHESITGTASSVTGAKHNAVFTLRGLLAFQHEFYAQAKYHGEPDKIGFSFGQKAQQMIFDDNRYIFGVLDGVPDLEVDNG